MLFRVAPDLRQLDRRISFDVLHTKKGATTVFLLCFPSFAEPESGIQGNIQSHETIAVAILPLGFLFRSLTSMPERYDSTCKARSYCSHLLSIFRPRYSGYTIALVDPTCGLGEKSPRSSTDSMYYAKFRYDIFYSSIILNVHDLSA